MRNSIDNQRRGTAIAVLIAFLAVMAVLLLLLARGRNEQATWRMLFNGRSLAGWKVADADFFEGHGAVVAGGGEIHLPPGDPGTGIRFTGSAPRINYEVELEAMRTVGSDFFCGLTFPIGEEQCTLVLGGWGGTTVGLSNVDGLSAAENETSTDELFENGCWYRIRLRVFSDEIAVWIDGRRVIELDPRGHQFSIWWEQEPMRPLGIAAWKTGAKLRGVRLRRPGFWPDS